MTTAILIICYLKQVCRTSHITSFAWPNLTPYSHISPGTRPHPYLKINFVDEICGPRCVQYKTPALHSFHLHKSPHMFLSLPGSHVTQVYFWLQGGCASVSGAGPRNPPHNTSCDEQSTDEKRKQTETVIMRSTHKITRPSIKLW